VVKAHSKEADMSFGWNCMFRKGSWLEFRRFVLLQRQNVSTRIEYINKELERIGSVRVLFETVGEGEDRRVTEKRVGLEVDASSSLGKLIKAYVAQGGNPFDISMFLQPDSYDWVEREGGEAASEDIALVNGDGQPFNFYKQYNQPYGGVLAPRTAGPSESEQIDTAGWLPIWKYEPRKLGSRNQSIYPRADEIGGVIYHARKWVTQEIAHLRNNIEAKIIKLCDLREQLMLERDDILFNALSGTVAGLQPFNPNNQLEELHLSHIVTNIDLNFFHARDIVINGEPFVGPPTIGQNVDAVSNQVPDFTKPRERGIDPYYKCLVDDAPNGEEDNTAL
jgi:hypothetical protein